jgi:hypothetical protein
MYVGIDVAKAELVVSIMPCAERFTVANDERGVRTLVERLRAIVPTLIVLEATGGYELRSVAALAAAALPVVVVNPRQVRDFAKATGQQRNARNGRNRLETTDTARPRAGVGRTRRSPTATKRKCSLGRGAGLGARRLVPSRSNPPFPARSVVSVHSVEEPHSKLTPYSSTRRRRLAFSAATCLR